MAFNRSDVENLLVETGRRCCICQLLHLVQVHHIHPVGEGGTDEIDNAIPLCPLCHDQVHANSAPGRVTKSYSHSELKLHRQRTIEMMRLPLLSTPAASSGTAPNGSLAPNGSEANLGTVSAYQAARNTLASADVARKILRITLRLRDLILSARTPAFFNNEAEVGKNILQADNLPTDGKTDTEMAWLGRWKPIHDANVELGKESLEAEIYFGMEARELIWKMQLLVGHFGIDLNMYLKYCSGEQRGLDPMREQLYKAVYDVAGSAETDEFSVKLQAAVEATAGYMRPRI